MTPILTLDDLNKIPEFGLAVLALTRLDAAQKAILSWSIIRDEHDEKSQYAQTIERLDQIKADEGKALRDAQANAQNAFIAFISALRKHLQD